MGEADGLLARLTTPFRRRPSGAGGERPRAFLHVPKCAGTSVVRALEQAFPPGARAPQAYDDATFGLDADYDVLQPAMRAAIAVGDREVASLADHALVCGHFTLSTLLRITAPERVATVVREPRARLLSLYAYWAIEELPEIEPYAPQRHAERPLGEFLEEREVASAIDNQLCRMVLHGDPRIPRSGFIPDAAAGELAAAAVQRLRSLAFVGIHELPDEMWAGLSRAFAVELTPARVNVTADIARAPRCPPLEQSLDAAALERLGRRVQVDRLIYRELVADALGGARPEAFEDAAFARQLVAFGALTAQVGGAPRSAMR